MRLVLWILPRTLERKQLLIVLGVVAKRDIHSGGNVDYTLVQLNMRLITVDSVKTSM
jgi:hypothetical protein